MEIAQRLLSLKDNHFDGEVRFRLRLASDEQSDVEPSLVVECAYEAHFHFHPASDQVDRDYVQRFVQSELPFVLLPYARHFVSDMTSRMQIGTIILPLRINLS